MYGFDDNSLLLSLINAIVENFVTLSKCVNIFSKSFTPFSKCFVTFAMRIKHSVISNELEMFESVTKRHVQRCVNTKCIINFIFWPIFDNH